MKVTVTAGDTTLVAPILNGPPGPAFAQAWGSFYDMTEQTNDAVVNTVLFTAPAIGNGVGVENDTELSVDLAGLYNVEFSFVFEKQGSSGASVDLWVAINGNDVADTGGRIHLSGSGAHTMASWNYFLPLDAGDYVEFRWYSANATVRIPVYENLTNPARPDIPSTIATMFRIDDKPEG